MPPVDPPVTGVLVVRAWIEEHPRAPLRAVVTAVDDLASDKPARQVAAASVEEVCRLVRDWLYFLEAGGYDAP